MSHDFVFWESNEPLESEEAGTIATSLLRHGKSDRARPSDKIAILAKEVLFRWPMPGPGREDDWPLASPPDVTESAQRLIRSLTTTAPPRNREIEALKAQERARQRYA